MSSPIGTAQGEKLAAQQVLLESTPAHASAEEIKDLLAGLGDIGAILGTADPALKAKRIGVRFEIGDDDR